ncbi:hypothetical protein [Streptomyces sp. NPDC007172]|uniref:hypothetical protein n=1 Tax=Streptomyces sp. NPDC007172 TaxID=3364776 RepID=UPI00369A13C5
MTKDHARKNRARRTMAATGAAYTTADAGLASPLLGHQHDCSTVFTPVDARGFGQNRTVPMDAATDLLGATIDWCTPCKVRATAVILDGDPVVIAAVAGLMGMAPGAGPRMSAATHVVDPLFQLARVTLDGAPILAAVTAMTREDRADLLEDSMTVWAAVSKAGPPRGDTDMSPAHDGTGYQVTAYTTWHTSRRGPVPAVFVATRNELLPGDHLRQCGWQPRIGTVTPVINDHWTVTVDATGAPTAITGLPWPDYPQAPVTLWQRTPETPAAPTEWLQAAVKERALVLVGPLADAEPTTVDAAKRAGTLFMVRAKVMRPAPVKRHYKVLAERADDNTDAFITRTYYAYAVTPGEAASLIQKKRLDKLSTPYRIISVEEEPDYDREDQ